MKTVHVFLGADLRCSHDGLKVQAKKSDIDLDKLRTGEAIVFINTKKNRIKAYSYNGVLSYIRLPNSQRIVDLSAIDYFPQEFNPNGTMDYARALKASLKNRLKAKGIEGLEML